MRYNRGVGCLSIRLSPVRHRRATMTPHKPNYRIKTCAQCSVSKPLEDFSPYRRNADGRHSYCKNCVAANAKTKRNRDLDKARKRERARPQRSATMTEARRKRCNQQSKKYRLQSPQKSRARSAVKHALLIGVLVRKPCERCGSENSEAHHEDYSKPLEVIWLCRLDHAARHIELREERRKP